MSTFRMKCSSCKEVSDLSCGAVCPSCGAPMPATAESYIQLYRMGSPIGIAVGYGIYIDGEPYGHIGNKQSLRIPLPYGTYTIHLTCGMTRKCNDPKITLSADAPVAYLKAHIRPGFWTNSIEIEPSDPSEMPPIE